MNKSILFFLLFPALLIGQSNDDVEVLTDTVAVKNTEWVNGSLQKKGATNPFTGIVRFPGVLNHPRNNKRFWHKSSKQYYTTATVVAGKINGTYTKWYKKNRQKRSEEIIKVTQQGIRIQSDGPYTLWHDNGQLAAKGVLRNGKREGKRTSWYKNGQLKSEAKYKYGKLVGKSVIWNNDGKKSIETHYYKGKTIKKLERDEHNTIVRTWPVVDKDIYGLKKFIETLVSTLQSENFDELEKLFPTNKDFKEITARSLKKEPSKEVIEEINKKYPIIVAGQFDEIKKEVLKSDYMFKDLSTMSVLYDYKFEKEGNSSKRVKWPKSINYDISVEKFVTAKVVVILNVRFQFVLETTLYYINNKWCFMELEMKRR